MKKKIIILFFIFIGVGIVNPQINDYLLDKGISYIYHINFDSASYQFKEFIKQNPKSPEGYFFEAMLEWWKINLNKNDESNDEIFFGKVSKVLEICDNILDENENDFKAIFYKGGILGYRGMLKSFRDSWLKAAEDGREALNLLERASEMQPNNKDAQLGIGIYNYFAEYVPDRYPVIRPLMLIFPKGDKIKGFMQIKETATNSRFAKTEANYILAYLYINYEKNFNESEYYARKLFEEFPENAIFEKYVYTSYVGLGRHEDAISGWKKVIEKGENKQTGYENNHIMREANYYISLSYFNLHRINEAEAYLNKCEEINKIIDKEETTSFTVNTYLMLGCCYDQKGDRSKAIYYYDKVLSLKDFNTHIQADLFKKGGYR
jgi:tetratricopeptide (TPR) repeat protein